MAEQQILFYKIGGVDQSHHLIHLAFGFFLVHILVAVGILGAAGVLEVDFQHTVFVIDKLLFKNFLPQQLGGAVQHAGVLLDFHALNSGCF